MVARGGEKERIRKVTFSNFFFFKKVGTCKYWNGSFRTERQSAIVLSLSPPFASGEGGGWRRFQIWHLCDDNSNHSFRGRRRRDLFFEPHEQCLSKHLSIGKFTNICATKCYQSGWFPHHQEGGGFAGLIYWKPRRRNTKLPRITAKVVAVKKKSSITRCRFTAACSTAEEQALLSHVPCDRTRNLRIRAHAYSP